MKFRKKPVVVEPEQYIKGHEKVPEGVRIDPEGHATIDLGASGILVVQDGDFIITGLAGERYPVHPARFWEIYEAV